MWPPLSLINSYLLFLFQLWAAAGTQVSLGSVSLATTWEAPVSLAAMADAPQPQPRSSTFLPPDTSGLFNRYLRTQSTQKCIINKNDTITQVDWTHLTVTNLKSTVAFIIIVICYLASACPPGQYIAQYGSGKGHNSGFSVQNRQVGVKSLNEISGVKLWELTISVLSIMNFFISSSDLTLVTYRRIKQRVPLCNGFKVSWPRKHRIIRLYMSAMLKRVKIPPVSTIYVSSTCLSRMRRPARHVCNVTKMISPIRALDWKSCLHF